MADVVTFHSHTSVCWINRILTRTSAECGSTVALTDGNNLNLFLLQMPSKLSSDRRCKWYCLDKHSDNLQTPGTQHHHSLSKGHVIQGTTVDNSCVQWQNQAMIIGCNACLCPRAQQPGPSSSSSWRKQLQMFKEHLQLSPGPLLMLLLPQAMKINRRQFNTLIEISQIYPGALSVFFPILGSQSQKGSAVFCMVSQLCTAQTEAGARWAQPYDLQILTIFMVNDRSNQSQNSRSLWTLD